MQKLKTISYYFFGVLYVVAGVLHFVIPEFYMKIMPPYLPFHLELVYLSGVAEIILGLGLLIPKYRGKAAIGIILLLIAVFPANLYMAFNESVLESLKMSQFAAIWIRLPIQGLLIWIACWQSRPS